MRHQSTSRCHLHGPALDAVLEGVGRALDLGAVRRCETGRFLNLSPDAAFLRSARSDWLAAARRVLRARER
jgi:hypothetical protein